ncbi:cell wall-active antibiotics response protein LiaF [Alkalihalobacillus sp. MEB130]|uniref:cell wall-active antibiotics response protein LiaF n=1 Tax=Alkalihalobacillus sp. MEB130 TaxID=2976704 RepID=UPI0028DFC4BA|nr:cell wall-active antibiotics response protein LiaF [Alkalihalobacillus sp. MEB130]MDT8862009.1 cell wall-active antibiotics response protein LiaF [Alkalihalobacillus sp. MEB130]
MKKQTLLGLIIVIIGFNMLINTMNLSLGSFVAPLIFFVIGLFFYKRKHSFISLIFFIITASIIFDQFLGMNFMGLLIAFAALYFGIRLVRSPKREKREKHSKRVRKENVHEPIKKQMDNQNESFTDTTNDAVEDRIVFTPTMRRSLIGEVHYLGEAFELHDLTIWNGIGEVRIDLSKAIIPEGETVIVVQTFIGEIDFYVPEDLAIAIQASSTIGEVSIFHEKHGGINQQISIATKDFKQSPRRVKLILSTFIGEVKVRVV